jgi:AraC family transcriptional regulator
VQSKVARREIAKAIAEGCPLSHERSGLLEMQVGVPIAVVAPGQGDVQAGEPPGGSIAVAVHARDYDQLGDTYAAMERWMETNRYRRGNAPWESYVTDPGEVPDVKDWRTEICGPLEK